MSSKMYARPALRGVTAFLFVPLLLACLISYSADAADASLFEKLAGRWVGEGRLGISGGNTENVKWAAGIHPALKDSMRMVVILSPAAKDDETLAKAWTFFKAQKKQIVLALTKTVDVPDPLRRNPRFDFSGDYKLALRQLMSALSE